MEEDINFRYVLDWPDINDTYDAGIQVGYHLGKKSTLPSVGQNIPITQHEYLGDGSYEVVRKLIDLDNNGDPPLWVTITVKEQRG